MCDVTVDRYDVAEHEGPCAHLDGRLLWMCRRLYNGRTTVDIGANMRQYQMKYLFIGLGMSVVVMTAIMHILIGDAGIHMLREIVSPEKVKIPFRSHDHHQEVPFVVRDDPVRMDSPGKRRADYAAQKGDSLVDLGPAWKLPFHLAENTVAVGCGITTRGHVIMDGDKLTKALPFFHSLLSSFCRTASHGFDYSVYAAHDHDDPFFSRNGSHAIFRATFHQIVYELCPRRVNVSLHLVECGHAGRPAWAQNDALMAAYMDNSAYYYRVNDDTEMESTGWTERFIEELMRFNPPNVGVVGPWFRSGNTGILTHDFVHRTHIDIFGFYYPRVFTDWFADDWITGVYSPERCRKVPGTRIKHTMEQGVRYVVHFEKAQRVALEVEIGKLILSRFLTRRQRGSDVKANWDKESKLVISMSLAGDSGIDHLYGMLRYSQLVPIVFTGWRVRVYVQDPDTTAGMTRVLRVIIRKLSNMDVEVVKLDNKTTTSLPASMWRFLVADDVAVERFVVRDADTRPGEREQTVLDHWMKTDVPIHCIRDHPNHTLHAFVPGLFGGIPGKLGTILGRPIRELMRGYSSDIDFLQTVVWPKVKSHCLCHDSVSCTRWQGAQAFPILRKENEFVGQRYDANDQVIDNDETLLWNRSFIQPECVYLKDTGFSEMAVRSVIRNRPLIWSQDYHVGPIMDIKSLLTPIGVKVIDKSLSYYCGHIGTCAKDLKVITQQNGMRLTPEMIRQFYEVYRTDETMQRVSAFVCTLPVAMCEAFVPFNKPMIIIATIRYEQARPEPAKWKALNELLLNISRSARGVVAANNLYDAKYIEYFTGIAPFVVPNYVGYLLRESYKPTRKQFLVAPIHSNELYEKIYGEFDSVIMRRKLDLVLYPLRQLYPQYRFSDLAAHPAVVYVPYQVSMISMTEQYRMNIPLFVPTLDLLAKWHVQHGVVRQRTWANYRQQRSSHSSIKGVLGSDVPDPNNDEDETAVRHWLRYADYYQWPHIVYFESVEDLVDKMATVDLDEISRRMRVYNEHVREKIKAIWSTILVKMTTGT